MWYNINTEDMRKCIVLMILDHYDYPFPSCLIMGKSGNRVIHVVASIEDGLLYIITAYIPNPDKWEEDWKTRKEDKQ